MNDPQRFSAHRGGCVSALPTPDRVIARPILIVDADASSRYLVGECLATVGLINPTIEASDGDDAIAELCRCMADGPDRVPALVVLDRQLPGCSGMDVLRWMRRMPGMERVAVVMLSGDDGACGVREAYELGVHSYLVKPVGFDALASVIRDRELPWMLT